MFVAVLLVVDRAILVQSPKRTLTYSQFYRAVEADRVADVTIFGQDLSGHLNWGAAQERSFETTIATASDVLPVLRAHNVNVTIESNRDRAPFAMLLQFIPIALMALLLLFILRWARRSER